MTKCDFQKSHLVINVINSALNGIRRINTLLLNCISTNANIKQRVESEKLVRGNSAEKVHGIIFY